MTALKKWLKKVVFGIAALLLAGLQSMGQSYIHHGFSYGPHGYGYLWTDYGMHVTLNQEEPSARLEGEVHEDQIRARTQESLMEKAAS